MILGEPPRKRRRIDDNNLDEQNFRDEAVLDRDVNFDDVVMNDNVGYEMPNGKLQVMIMRFPPFQHATDVQFDLDSRLRSSEVSRTFSESS